MKGECNSKMGKQSFTVLDTAEPHLILCKDNANERKESLLFVSRVQLILCKDTIKSHKIINSFHSLFKPQSVIRRF